MYRGVDSVTAEGQNWDTCEMPKYKINLCESVLRASLAEQRVKAALSSLLLVCQTAVRGDKKRFCYRDDLVTNEFH